MKLAKIAFQITVSFACAMAVTFFGSGLLTRVRILRAAGSIPEFTLTQVQTSKGSNDPNIDKPMEERTVAVANNGLIVHRTRDLTVGYSTRSIFDPVKGVQLEIWDDSKTYSLAKLSPTEVQDKLQQRINPDSGCAAVMDGHAPNAHGNQTDLGDGMTLNIPTRNFSYDFGGGFVATSYLAPTLACESLFDQYISPDKGVATMRTVGVTFGAPDPALFAVGSDYVEGAYTESFLAHLKASKIPQMFTPSFEKGIKRRDEFYRAHRP